MADKTAAVSSTIMRIRDFGSISTNALIISGKRNRLIISVFMRNVFIKQIRTKIFDVNGLKHDLCQKKRGVTVILIIRN